MMNLMIGRKRFFSTPFFTYIQSLKKRFSLTGFSGNVSFQFRILLSITLLVVIVMGVLGTVSYLGGKRWLAQYTDDRLMVSARNVSEKVDLFTTTVDKRELTRKAGYLLLAESNSLSNQGMDPRLLILGPDGEQILKSWQGKTNFNLPAVLVDNIIKQRNGLITVQIDGNPWRIAYQHVPGNNWTYVIGLAEKDYLRPINQLRNLIILVALVTILATFLICAFGARKFAGPLQELTGVMDRARVGDLTVRVQRSGAGREFNLLGNGLNGMLSQLGHLFSRFRKTADALQKTSHQMNRVADNQVNFALQTEKCVGNMADTVEQVTEQVMRAKHSSEEMIRLSEDGMKALKTVVSKITENRRLISSSATAINELERQIQEVGKIVDIINGISGQTHLLSLNASIEAARAGAQGRGFAVVAEEVRRLADGTNQATAEVSSIIQSIRESSRLVSERVEVGTRVADEGVKTVNKAEETLQQIYQSIFATGEQISAIVAAAKEISRGTREAVHTVQLIAGSKVSEEKQVSAREVAAMAAQLAVMADEMQRELEHFNIEGRLDGEKPVKINQELITA